MFYNLSKWSDEKRELQTREMGAWQNFIIIRARDKIGFIIYTFDIRSILKSNLLSKDDLDKVVNDKIHYCK